LKRREEAAARGIVLSVSRCGYFFYICSNDLKEAVDKILAQKINEKIHLETSGIELGFRA
jgi:hypothetical protein